MSISLPYVRSSSHSGLGLRSPKEIKTHGTEVPRMLVINRVEKDQAQTLLQSNPTENWRKKNIRTRGETQIYGPWKIRVAQCTWIHKLSG